MKQNKYLSNFLKRNNSDCWFDIRQDSVSISVSFCGGFMCQTSFIFLPIYSFQRQQGSHWVGGPSTDVISWLDIGTDVCKDVSVAYEMKINSHWNDENMRIYIAWDENEYGKIWTIMKTHIGQVMRIAISINVTIRWLLIVNSQQLTVNIMIKVTMWWLLTVVV